MVETRHEDALCLSCEEVVSRLVVCFGKFSGVSAVPGACPPHESFSRRQEIPEVVARGWPPAHLEEVVPLVANLPQEVGEGAAVVSPAWQGVVVVLREEYLREYGRAGVGAYLTGGVVLLDVCEDGGQELGRVSGHGLDEEVVPAAEVVVDEALGVCLV